MSKQGINYSHILSNRPSAVLSLVQESQQVMTKECRRCGAEYKTTSRIRKRCDDCQTTVAIQKYKKANERARARKAAEKLQH